LNGPCSKPLVGRVGTNDRGKGGRGYLKRENLRQEPMSMKKDVTLLTKKNRPTKGPLLASHPFAKSPAGFIQYIVKTIGKKFRKFLGKHPGPMQLRESPEHQIP